MVRRTGHAVAALLLALGGGVWAGAWSTLSFEDGTVAAALALEGPLDNGADIAWRPEMITPAAQMEQGALSVARVIVVAGSGVFAVALLSALLLWSGSRTEKRRDLRVHRAVGASLTRLRRAATLEACLAVAVAVLGASALGVLLSRGSAVVWSRGVGEPSDAAFGLPLLACALLLPAIATVVSGLFRALVPISPLPPSSRPRFVKDPLSGFAVCQVSITVAAVFLTLLLPDAEPARQTRSAGSWMEVATVNPLDTPRLAEALSSVEGVRAAYATSPGAWLGLGTQDFVLSDCGRCFIGGLPTPFKGENAVHAWVGPNAADGLDLAVAEGRTFDPADYVGDARVVLVTRDFADANFEEGRAVGRRVQLGRDPEAWYDVIGIVETEPKAVALGAEGQVAPWVFMPAAQGTLRAVTVWVDGDAPEHALRAAALAVAPDATVRTEAMDRVVSKHAHGTRWFGLWLGLLGAAALVISLAGVFTATRAQVRQRLTELAVRRAVGARRRTILRSVLGQAVRIAALGIPLGLWVATFAVQALRDTSGVQPPGAAGVIGIAVTVLIACVLGGFGPARRASRLPPAEALRRAA